MYPFAKSSVRFQTPPKRRRVAGARTMVESDWSAGDLSAAEAVVSPELVAAISRHIVAEVESRTVPTIQSG